jgi:hypothetical protein
MLPFCLVAIVLLIDVSGSVPDEMYAAQRDGAAAAFEDPRLLHAIEASDGVAVLVAQFDTVAATRLGWTLIRDGVASRGFARDLRAIDRLDRHRPTAIGRAIAHASDALAEAPCAPNARLIDISTDGHETDPHPPAREARDAAAAEGIVINAIAFEPFDGLGQGAAWVALALSETEAWLHDNVATGFVRVATGATGFHEAFRGKVVFEITQAVPPP